MDPDKRIVPEKHISYLLEEDHLSERTIEVKKLLQESPSRIHRVAHTWMGHSGLNPLARVIIHHIPEIPRKSQPHKSEKIHFIHEEHEYHEVHHTVHEKNGETHGLHSHGEGHSHIEKHGHEKNHSGTRHHGQSSAEHHGTFSGFISTGHWFGDQGAYIFSIAGRIFGEIIGYLFKILALAIIFGPTRTALLILCLGAIINTTMDANIPVGIIAGIAGIVHLIFTSINKMSGGGHGGGHSEGGHGGGVHGHSEAHGHH